MRAALFSSQEILETIRMVQMEKLDIRTITMGISLRDCAAVSLAKVATRLYDKICRRAARLAAVGEEIEREYGIPIINKRIFGNPCQPHRGKHRGTRLRSACRGHGSCRARGRRQFYRWLLQSG